MRYAQKQFNSIRQGRVNVRKELRQQLLIRNNLEKRFFRNLKTMFRKFVNVQMHLYREYGIFEVDVANRNLDQEFIPVLLAHYRRVFRTMFKYNQDKYNAERKTEEAFVFDRSVDLEKLVDDYFSTRQLILAGITTKMAERISRLIQQGRSDGLTLQQITKLVSDKFLPISRSRSAMIARTETHNASSFANHTYHKEAHKNLGMKMVKRWASTNDTRTRSFHASANGQTVDMDEKFTIDGVKMDYAGDPAGGARNVINCRCVIIYSDEADVVLD